MGFLCHAIVVQSPGSGRAPQGKMLRQLKKFSGLWLRKSKLGFKFRREHPISQYRLDSFCREAMLAVEMDGEQHDPVRDVTPDAAMAELGILTYRVENRRFFGLDDNRRLDVIGDIRRLCETRSGRPAFAPSPPEPSPPEGEESPN